MQTHECCSLYIYHILMIFVALAASQWWLHKDPDHGSSLFVNWNCSIVVFHWTWSLTTQNIILNLNELINIVIIWFRLHISLCSVFYVQHSWWIFLRWIISGYGRIFRLLNGDSTNTWNSAVCGQSLVNIVDCYNDLTPMPNGESRCRKVWAISSVICILVKYYTGINEYILLTS